MDEDLPLEEEHVGDREQRAGPVFVLHQEGDLVAPLCHVLDAEDLLQIRA